MGPDPDATTGASRDLSQADRSAAEQRRTAARFERVFRTDAVGLALVDRKTGCVEDCNAQMAAFFGRPPDDLLTRHVAQFESFFPDRECYQRLLISWASGTPLHAIPIVGAWPDGSKRHGLLTILPLADGDPPATLDVAVVVDLTEHHREEAERRQAQRLDAIGQLAGGIAHDFNNLLAVISGYTELLEDSAGRSPEDRESLNEIKHAAGRAGRLIQGLLAFSRQAPFDVRTIDLNESIARSVGPLREIVGPQVEMRLNLQAARARVQTDALQLEHVLLQLATNARDAMPDGGTLTFATSDADAHVQLTVSDTGIGIEPATLERVFEPFFTTKELGGGLGLGLSTVYGIVTQSGGRVTAASEPARGTAIQITLPVADGHASARHQVSLPETASVVGTETILLIEDDPALAMLVESFLVRLGYRLIHVPNGSEALRAGRRYGTRIDLMIGNVHAPSASGRLLLDELRLLVPDLPAVLIVDALEPADPGHAGAHTSVLTRPFAMAELASHARTLLDRGLRLEA